MSIKLKTLNEQVMVITGATSGIGLATARMAAEGGAHLVLAAHDGDALDTLAHEMRQRGVEVATVTADVGNPADVARIGQGKTASPSFLFACLLWHDVELRWDALRAEGVAPLMALDQAADEVLAAQAERLAIQRRIATDMREIWSLQSRFERRTPRYANSLVEHPRFRAAYDFLSLRARSGQAEPELAQWWEAFQFADAEGRAEMLAAAPQPSAAAA